MQLFKVSLILSQSNETPDQPAKLLIPHAAPNQDLTQIKLFYPLQNLFIAKHCSRAKQHLIGDSYLRHTYFRSTQIKNLLKRFVLLTIMRSHRCCCRRRRREYLTHLEVICLGVKVLKAIQDKSTAAPT